MQSSKERRYAWLVIVILLFVNISNQWQRFVISTSYYYKPDGREPVEKYSMREAIPNFTDAKYGLVAGPVFTLCYAVLILFTGSLADLYSRKTLLAVGSICWSLTSIGTSFAHSFTMVCTYRMLLGVFEAFSGPIAYSLIVDYFPPEKRTIANSMYSLGIYVGVGLSSLTVLLIGAIGWRKDYFLIGCFGIIVGLCVVFFVKDPKRARFDVKKPEVVKEITEVQLEEKAMPDKKPSLLSRYLQGILALLRNRCTMWILFGGMCRFWQGFTISYYAINYFNTFHKEE